jgi:outer membrane protein assembly factor BamA
MRLPLRVLATLLLLAPLAAHAQYSIATITFKHPGPYTRAELLAASGLEPGQALMNDSLGNAAQRLLNTGLFSDATIDYTSTGKARDIVVDLKPIPLDKLLPASFENLVWFTPDELAAGIHAHVPLYRGVASDAGTLPDDIQSALQQMLTAKGITATLSHEIIEPTSQHPQLTVNFKVDTPRIVLAQTDITGIPDALKENTLQILHRTQGGPYNEGLTGFTVEDIVLIPAHAAGYLNARLQDVQRSLTPTSNGIAVTYTATFVPGDPYKISTVTWTPSPVYSAADFTRDAELHPGDPASDLALRHTEAAISRAYLRQGYIDVYVLPHPALDAATHTVAYTLTAIPGDIYRLHAVTVTGLTPQARALFDADWQMKSGDPYSDLGVSDFLARHAAQPVFRQYDAGFKAIGDPQTHLVDLTLTFTPNGSKAY